VCPARMLAACSSPVPPIAGVRRALSGKSAAQTSGGSGIRGNCRTTAERSEEARLIPSQIAQLRARGEHDFHHGPFPRALEGPAVT